MEEVSKVILTHPLKTQQRWVGVNTEKTSLDPDGDWVCDVAATFMWVSFIVFHSVFCFCSNSLQVLGPQDACPSHPQLSRRRGVHDNYCPVHIRSKKWDKSHERLRQESILQTVNTAGGDGEFGARFLLSPDEYLQADHTISDAFLIYRGLVPKAPSNTNILSFCHFRNI